MTPELQVAIDRLSPTQQRSVAWEEGAALVLAGPGVGKTTALTTRIARILAESRTRHFRILTLTFTKKAGDEIRSRVEEMVPGLTERTLIGTFHSFCARMLRQHGSHLQIKPDFGIYEQDEDREELLYDALHQAASNGEPVNKEDIRWLKTIDRLRSNLISPQKTAKHFHDAATGDKVARVYTIYENALRDRKVTDFNGMILDACRLVQKVPAVAALIRKAYPYWLIDEFQNTTPAQYQLIRFLAGDEFKNIFAVADDDQINYQLAGPSFRQITDFRKHFTPELFQLVENRCCPPAIVQAANNVISHNAERIPGKKPLVPKIKNNGSAIDLRVFDTDEDEAMAVASEMSLLQAHAISRAAVLGRTRAVLKPVVKALECKGVSASIATRRNKFVSAQFLWLQNCLELVIRPADRRMFTSMVAAANRIGNVELEAPMLATEAECSGASYLEYWSAATKKLNCEIATNLGAYADRLVQSRANWREVVSDALNWLPTTIETEEGLVNDVDEDKAAWDEATRAIRKDQRKQIELSELLQVLALRPKDPPLDPKTVRLYTIHSAKGLEFDNVWLLGLAESILPAWQSLRADSEPAELEEERRSFIAAITRTRKRLILSYASNYCGRPHQISRFVNEMNTKNSGSRASSFAS